MNLIYSQWSQWWGQISYASTVKPLKDWVIHWKLRRREWVIPLISVSSATRPDRVQNNTHSQWYHTVPKPMGLQELMLSFCCWVYVGWSWLTLIFKFCVCVLATSAQPPNIIQTEKLQFSDWLHMECLQRPTVHLGWLSSFFKTIWSLLKLSLFKEPAEREESNLGLRRKRRNKI